MFDGRSSWPGRVAHHEFGFDAGEAPVDGAEALGCGAAFAADEGLVRLHVPVDSVELEARVHGEHENDHKAAVDDVAEDFQIVESGATVSAEEFHQGVGLTLG